MDFNIFGLVKKKLNTHLQYQQLNQQQQQQQQLQQLQNNKGMKQSQISHFEKMAEVFYSSTQIQVNFFTLLPFTQIQNKNEN